MLAAEKKFISILTKVRLKAENVLSYKPLFYVNENPVEIGGFRYLGY
jgi:hypothetical protein